MTSRQNRLRAGAKNTWNLFKNKLWQEFNINITALFPHLPFHSLRSCSAVVSDYNVTYWSEICMRICYQVIIYLFVCIIFLLCICYTFDCVRLRFSTVKHMNKQQRIFLEKEFLFLLLLLFLLQNFASFFCVVASKFEQSKLWCRKMKRKKEFLSIQLFTMYSCCVYADKKWRKHKKII